MKKIHVYIASPYTIGDTGLNVRVSMLMFHRLLNYNNGKTFVPFCPLWCHFQHILTPEKYDTWMEWDLAWLEKCDCILRLPGESAGASKEVDYAISKDIPVFFSLDELTNYYGV